MQRIPVVPIILSPARIPGAHIDVLAGHPGTKVIEIHLLIDGQIVLVNPLQLCELSNELLDYQLCSPFTPLMRRLYPGLKPLLAAEDLARLVGLKQWTPNGDALLARNEADLPKLREAVRSALPRLAHLLAMSDGLITEAEQEVYALHERINRRGMPMLEELTSWLHQAVLHREQQRTASLGDAFQQRTSVREALNPGGLLDQLLADEGIALPGRSEDDLLDVLERDDLSVPARQALRTLIGHGRIAARKVRRMLATASKDGRLRYQFRIWGARTLRFTSGGVQLQNMPKAPRNMDLQALVQALPAVMGTPSDADLAHLASTAPTGIVEEAFAGLVRMCFHASAGKVFIILDWNAIEPRIRAWLSDDEEHLTLWRNGVDLYCELISSLLGRPVTKASDPQARDVGKIADIGNGYQMGEPTFARLCSTNGIDLAAQGLTAAKVVKAYRLRYHRIADPESGLWARLERGALQAVLGTPTSVGRVRFEMTLSGHLDLVLPNGSGRRYWHPIIERRSPPWSAAGDHSQDRDVLVVAKNVDDCPSEVLYGGRWLENVCQSVGREILAGFLVEAEKAAPDAACVGHVHDEAIFEVPEERAAEVLQELIHLAEQAPPWAAGLPLKVEAHIAPFWSKQPLPWWESSSIPAA